jgi:formylglycine-generating enzyme required for sulfatase activity
MLALGGAADSAWAGNFINHVGISFVDIPSGRFVMGSCKEDAKLAAENKRRAFMGLPPNSPSTCSSGTAGIAEAQDDETPQREVSIAAFQLGETEVTLGQFKQFITAAGRNDLLSDEFMAANAQGDLAAVSYISWNDAQDFIAWLNRGKPADDAGSYRLPSEAEWEYAARAGSGGRYAFGDDPAQLDDYAWYKDNADDRGQGYAHATAGKKANAWGLYDMHGNVWEWVADCWHGNYRKAPSDGRAWTAGCIGHFRVLRGGSWSTPADSLRAAYRHSEMLPSRLVRGNSTGFRVVRAQ